MQERAQTGFDEEKRPGKSRDLRLLARLYPFARSYRALLFITFILMVLITVFELAVPYITKVAIDTYIVPGFRQEKQQEEKQGTWIKLDLSDPDVDRAVSAWPDRFRVSGDTARISFSSLSELPPEVLSRIRESHMHGLVYVAALLVSVIFLNFGASFFQVFIMEYIGQTIMHDLRMKLFSHIQSLTVRFFTHNPVGRLVTRVSNDIQNMHEMFTSVLIFVMKDIFLLTGITIVLFSIDWQLSLASFAIFPFVFYGAGKFAGAAREAFRTLRIKIAEINSHFSETIGGMSAIQLFRQEEANLRRFKRLNHEYFSAGMKQVTVFAFFMPFIELMSSVVLAVVIFYGGHSLIAERITLGTLVVFISYLRMFFRPIRDIAEKYNITLNALSSAERIFLILDETDREQEESTQELLPVPPAIREIAFENVCFSYNKGEEVLKDISFSIRNGETLAVVGPTGAGKTSLINLITRFYDPDSGRVLVNKKDIRRYTVSGLRSKIALVMQDPFLFSATIRENIFPERAGSVSPEELDRVLEKSNCRSFVDRLSDGADTRISEGGLSLSSGQRQLISIARAIASDPEVIVFDEATSYIDSETEASIQEALAGLMAERTVILIAHRLSTAKAADTILVMRQGAVVESGSHERLMAAGGFYRRLVEIRK